MLSRLSEERALFWLDAHYSGGDTAKGQSNTPVMSELEAILAYSRRNDIILVDDLRYFWTARPGFFPTPIVHRVPVCRRACASPKKRCARI